MGQKRKSNKRFLEEVHEKYGNDYDVMDEYTLGNNKIHIRHNICGATFVRKACDFLAGRQCPYCFGINKSPERYEKDFNIKNKGKFKLISSYNGSNEDVEVLCLVCNTSFSRQARSFVSTKSRNCPYCTGHMIRPNDYANEFKRACGSKYTQLTPFKHSKCKIKVRHNKCGREYWVDPHEIINGSQCMLCYGNPRKTTQQFNDEVCSCTNGEYLCTSKYINSKTDVEFYHKVCKNHYKATPHDFLGGNRCPYCKQSKGEKNIQNILDKLDISYEIQKAFDDCGNKHQWLPFDFYVESLNLLIEYDGIQHYKEVKYFGGRDKLLDQQRRDEVKNKYCVDESINLLRIPYFITNEQIQEKLPKYINKYKAESPKPKVRTMI